MKDRCLVPGCGRVRHRVRLGLCDKHASSSYRGNPDVAYVRWLRGKGPAFPRLELVAVIDELRARRDNCTVTDVASDIGIDESRLRRILRGHPNRSNENVAMDTAERVFELAGIDMPYDYYAQHSGADGWSKYGRSCGDGSVFVGCGTFFHEHHSGGLCEECYQREVLGVGPELPRDVRLSGVRS